MAPIGGWCDALTGEKKEECLREERRRQEQDKQGAKRERCDALIGPERERCLRRGGSLEVNAEPGGASTGATAQ